MIQYLKYTILDDKKKKKTGSAPTFLRGKTQYNATL